MNFHEITIVWGIIRKLPLSSSSKILVHGMKHTWWPPRRWAMADSCLRCQCDNIQKICPEQEIAGWLVVVDVSWSSIICVIYIYIFMRYSSISMSTPKKKCDDDPQQDAGAVPSDATSAEALFFIEGVEDLWIFWGQLQYKLFDIGLKKSIDLPNG